MQFAAVQTCEVFDEFVHFKIWHQWMLAPFCNLSTASAALRRVPFPGWTCWHGVRGLSKLDCES